MTANRGTLWWARIVCLSAFGPYVTGSARTEQIAVFASLLFILVTGWRPMVNARFGPAPFVLAWGGLCAVLLISTVWRPFDPEFYGAQPPSHALSAMLLPLALVLITWYWTLSAEPVLLIRAVAPLIVAAMCVNTVIELAQLSAGKAALGVLPRFWDAAPSVGSVAANAAENGRFTGIFDEPSEAGIAYGVALLCLIWLARRGVLRFPAVLLAAAALVTGGLLPVSKVFLLGALPVAAFTVLRGPARMQAALLAACAGAIAWLAGTAGLLPAWASGAAVLAQLTHPGPSLAASYTAGRYGAGGTLSGPAGDVLRAAPLAGFGAGGLDVPYDSLWLEVLTVAGVFGVILAAAALAMLAWRWLALHRFTELPERHLAAGVLVLAAGASLGIPSLTANRAATLLWLVLGVLVTARSAAANGRAGFS